MNTFYTRTGDDGFTGILGKDRVSKFSPRIEALGTLDELNSVLGIARVSCKLDNNKTILLDMQQDLYQIMAELAAAPENAEVLRKIDETYIEKIETYIQTTSREVDAPGKFITPGDTFSGALLDLARTVTRRAERRVTQLYANGEISNIFLMQYLNRLSSLCFILELAENLAS